jgi:hypothetical protein
VAEAPWTVRKRRPAAVEIDELVDALADLLADRLAWQHHCAEEQAIGMLEAGDE